MKAIDEMRTHMNLMWDQGLEMTAISTVKTHLNEIERELEEGYVELPKDKNDIPIHIGDVLQGERFSGGWCNPFKVIRMRIDEDGWEVYELGNGHIPNLCRHKPPTVEDVLREFADLVRKERVEQARISDDTVAEFAERLQLRKEDE